MRKNKIGRNDPCPCGSGKKYKKCCLLKVEPDKISPESIFGDSASMRMQILLSKTDHSDFEKAYKAPSLDIEKSIMSAVCSSPDKMESERTLLLWKDRVEQEIKRLCSKHSKYYWLYLLRRIFPKTSERISVPTTPYLHQTTFNLAVLKYGDNNQSEEFVAIPSSANTRQYILKEDPYCGETVDMENIGMIEVNNEEELKEANPPSIIPRQITSEDVLNLFQIDYLTLDYYVITAQLRRFWKGGQMRVRQGEYDGIDLPREVEKLVKLYDQRVPIYGNLLSEFGSITNLKAVEEKGSREGFLIFIPVANIDMEKIPLVFPGEEFFNGKIKGPVYLQGNPTNFILMPVSIKPFYEKMCVFRHFLIRMLGFSPEELVTFLIALDKHTQNLWMKNIHLRYHYIQRGYSIKPNNEDYRRYIVELYKTTYRHLFNDHVPEADDSSFKRVMDYMTYNPDNFGQINLWDRTGAKLFLKVPGGTLMDNSAIPAFLQSIFSELSKQISLDGQIGQVRGDDFQHEVEKYLKLNVVDLELWMCHRKLQFLSGLERDIDISFSLGQVLFAVECKAFSVPDAFDRGETGALGAREEKLDTALKQVDTLCELLSKEHKGNNFELPQSITHIIGLVASPFPEYISKLDEQHFLTDDIPRVCTPEEIAVFIKVFTLSSCQSKPFVWRVSRLASSQD
jgi:hypothetical protein